MKAVIFAAGRGLRLSSANLPKPLVPLQDGRSILERMVGMLNCSFPFSDIAVVVGYMAGQIVSRFPQLQFIHNRRYASDNNYLSMLLAIEAIPGEDILFVNGDVVCDEDVLRRVICHPGTCSAVTYRPVGDEEMKFSLGPSRNITKISKRISDGLGEVIGVNKIAASDLPLVERSLKRCASNEYYEDGLQLAITEGLRIEPIDVSDLPCCEIDFPEDLREANKMFFSATNV